MVVLPANRFAPVGDVTELDSDQILYFGVVGQCRTLLDVPLDSRHQVQIRSNPSDWLQVRVFDSLHLAAPVVTVRCACISLFNFAGLAPLNFHHRYDWALHLQNLVLTVRKVT